MNSARLPFAAAFLLGPVVSSPAGNLSEVAQSPRYDWSRALQRAKFGWFDLAHQAYRDIPVDQQVEMISLIGDVGLVNGQPQVHTHGTVGLPDGQVRGGRS